ncbi:MAG TPA: hypothetical protein VK923_15615 [Euzebyales bacterium]|nr:hypothetical protein [Euzebyales bacterium]
MNAERLVELIVRNPTVEAEVNRVRRVATIYKDRYSIAVVDHDDRVWNVHVLRDHAEHGFT